jgi:uncharacterized membrane protein
MRSSLKVLSLFFVIFLLFNSGLVYEVAKDRPGSISLNSTIDYPRFNEQEVVGAKWWYSVKGKDPIYADAYRYLLVGSFEWGQMRSFPVDIDKIREDSYMYFGTLNVVDNMVLLKHKTGARSILGYIGSEDIVNKRNMIYTNGCAEVYYR